MVWHKHCTESSCFSVNLLRILKSYDQFAFPVKDCLQIQSVQTGIAIRSCKLGGCFLAMPNIFCPVDPSGPFLRMVACLAMLILIAFLRVDHTWHTARLLVKWPQSVDNEKLIRMKETFCTNSFLISNYPLLDAFILSNISPAIVCKSSVDFGRSWAGKLKFAMGAIASSGLTSRLHTTLVKRGRIKFGWKTTNCNNIRWNECTSKLKWNWTRIKSIWQLQKSKFKEKLKKGSSEQLFNEFKS